MTPGRRTRQVDPGDNCMRASHPSLAWGAWPPIDPDAEERRDQCIGNWVVVVAYG